MANAQIEWMVLGMVSTNTYLVKNQDTGELLIIDPADDAFAVRSWCLNDGRKSARWKAVRRRFFSPTVISTICWRRTR